MTDVRRTVGRSEGWVSLAISGGPGGGLLQADGGEMCFKPSHAFLLRRNQLEWKLMETVLGENVQTSLHSGGLWKSFSGMNRDGLIIL